jgi:capsular polysaccharide biosynthesis protein
MVQVGERRDPDLVMSVARRWYLVVAFVCVGAVVGFFGSLAMSRVYEANTSLMVGQFGSGDVTINDVKATQSLAATYADLARREPVMQGVINDLRLDMSWRELVNDVHSKIPREDPQVVDITVDASSPRRAEMIAASVARNVIRAVKTGIATQSTFLQNQLTGLQSDIESITKRLDELRNQVETADRFLPAVERARNDLHTQLAQDQQNYATLRAIASPASSGEVRLLDGAYASNHPVRPNTRFNIIIASFVGLVLGVALAYLLAARRRYVPAGQPPAETDVPQEMRASEETTVFAQARLAEQTVMSEETNAPDEAIVPEETMAPAESASSNESRVSRETKPHRITRRQETRVPEETSVSEHTALSQETEVSEDTALSQETEVSEETPVPEQTKVPARASAPNGTPVADDTSVLSGEARRRLPSAGSST